MEKYEELFLEVIEFVQEDVIEGSIANITNPTNPDDEWND